MDEARTNSAYLRISYAKSLSWRREMHSSSLKWESPRYKKTEQNHKLNAARQKVCRKSPFWHENFDLPKHKEDWEAGRKRKADQAMKDELAMTMERMQLQEDVLPVPHRMHKAFGGKEFKTIGSAVLGIPTVFCTKPEDTKDQLADWPPRSEARYEGDERIQTDRLHGRFPGAPRVPGNETVNWQHRSIVYQHSFDDFYFPIPQAVDIFMRTHWIAELEFTDEEGEQALGKDLMALLDPQDQW